MAVVPLHDEGDTKVEERVGHDERRHVRVRDCDHEYEEFLRVPHRVPIGSEERDTSKAEDTDTVALMRTGRAQSTRRGGSPPWTCNTASFAGRTGRSRPAAGVPARS